MPRLETHHLAWTMLVVAAIGGGTLLGNRAAQPRPRFQRPSTDCESLKGHRVAATQIGLPTGGAIVTEAVLQPPVVAPPDRPAEGLPEYCSLTGTIAPVDKTAPNITFRLNIPTQWNGKAWQVGGGGLNGIIPPNLAAMSRRGSPLGASYPPDVPSPLAQGYAMYGSDSGHQGGGLGPPRGSGRSTSPASAPADGSGKAPATPADPQAWMLNDEAWTNFAYAQIKKTHDVAMRLMDAMYGSRARITYFGGESQGGREALEAVSRYPSDYDGVIAIVPLAYFAGLLIDPTIKGVAQLPPGAWVPPAKAAAIRAEILRLCDALDGLEDGVINNYGGCNRKLDPRQTQQPLAHIACKGSSDTGADCLSPAQMATIDAFHGEETFGYPLANGEQTWPGWGTGLEGPNGWLLSSVQPDANSPGAFNAGIGATMQRARIGGTQDFNLLTLDVQKYKPQLQAISDAVDIREDWTRFFRRNGKLIMLTAASDYISNPRAQMRLYDRIVARHGQRVVDRAVRYYVSPNVGHSSTGASASGTPVPHNVDLIGQIQRWVENGQAPADPLVQTRRGPTPPYDVLASRPLCRYPRYPKYRGQGDTSLASSYVCATE